MMDADKLYPVGFRLQAGQVRFLKKMAKMRGCSLSKYVREILEREMRCTAEESDDPIMDVAGIFAIGTLSRDIDEEIYES